MYTAHAHIGKRKVSSVSSHAPSKKPNRSNGIFELGEHCLYCGEPCTVDIKRPSKNSNISIVSRNTVKEDILRKCAERSDPWGDEVRTRISGAISDLVAARARYHRNCRVRFNYEAGQESQDMEKECKPMCSGDLIENECETEDPLEKLIHEMRISDTILFWDSLTLYDMYKKHGGVVGRRSLISQLLDQLKDQIIVLKSQGSADIVAFRDKTKHIMKLSEYGVDGVDESLTNVSDRVVREVNSTPVDRDAYHISTDESLLAQYSSDTLMEFLAKLTPKLNRTLPAMMIANMVHTAISGYPTPLLTNLSIFVREKKLINKLHKFGVTSSYDESRRFKQSAAAAEVQSITNRGICQTKDNDDGGVIQIIVDNFDCNISSQNCTLSTHSLAMLVTQNNNGKVEHRETIPRIGKLGMKEHAMPEITVQRYQGEKTPSLPVSACAKTVLPLKVLSQQVISKTCAENADFSFLKCMVSTDNCPEYSGYNTQASRDTVSPKHKSTAVYMPLIDMKPADPDTMLTAMIEGDKISTEAGQSVVVMTCDQQLYKVAVNIMWAYPRRFDHFFLRLGGMHTLMSFVGAVGHLMANTGLSDLLTSAFGSVPAMLSGKKYPQNVRAMRMVIEEVLRDVMEDPSTCEYAQLMIKLRGMANASRTANLWVNVLIKGVFIMMMFVRAERESDWPLHLHAIRLMLPYFFAAGHHQYSRYALYYLRTCEKLAEPLLHKFLNGDHTLRHKTGIWNATWSDMYIESTFMKYGKGPAGIIGVSMKKETVGTWALSLHTCSNVTRDISEIADGDTCRTEEVHKEEMRSRIAADSADRYKIRTKLSTYTHPLDVTKHPTDAIVNIATGQFSTVCVNVDNAIRIGSDQVKTFETSWPQGFNKPIPKKVITMAPRKTKKAQASSKVYDTKLIYSRVIGIQSSRNIQINDVLRYELAPVPVSMFRDDGTMRIAESKSTLKARLSVIQVDSETASNVSTNVFLDGCALMWVIHWPNGGTVTDYVNNIMAYLKGLLVQSHVYLVFDRYRQSSIKDSTRRERTTKKAQVNTYDLHPATTLPEKTVVLSSPRNKTSLINTICDELELRRNELNTDIHKLVVTGQRDTPFEVRGCGEYCQRNDLVNTHEEADVILVNQVVKVAESNEDGSITIIADDTDILVLTMHYVHSRSLKTHIKMQSTIRGRSTVDVTESVTKNKNIVSQLLVGHALSGCDTVAHCHGIGKVKMVKILETGFTFKYVGNVNATMTDVEQEATDFISQCYGLKGNITDITDARIKVWLAKTSRKEQHVAPDLSELPPTKESFTHNARRAHFQACVWLAATESSPPNNLQPITHGWYRDCGRLMPITTLPSVKLAPDYIMQLVSCKCKSSEPCQSKRCSCTNTNMSCTVFCGCHASPGCCNPNTAHDDDDDEVEEEDVEEQ